MPPPPPAPLSAFLFLPPTAPETRPAWVPSPPPPPPPPPALLLLVLRPAPPAPAPALAAEDTSDGARLGPLELIRAGFLLPLLFLVAACDETDPDPDPDPAPPVSDLPAGVVDVDDDAADADEVPRVTLLMRGVAAAVAAAAEEALGALGCSHVHGTIDRERECVCGGWRDRGAQTQDRERDKRHKIEAQRGTDRGGEEAGSSVSAGKNDSTALTTAWT